VILLTIDLLLHASRPSHEGIKMITEITERELEATPWDAIVIGTGIGGGTIGYALARTGKRVLYLEKGRSSILGSRPIEGGYPEEMFDLARLTSNEHDELLARGGRNTEWFEDTTPGRRPKKFRPIMGSGTGGSSAIYGMVTERFFQDDFTPRENFRDTGDSTVPDAWPVTYDEMVPWYRKAEQLYRVRGTADPLRPDDDTDSLGKPGPMTAGNAEMTEFLESRGMHPYGLHVACEYRDGCRACQSYLCAANCKNHAGNICVEPSVRNHHATLLDQATVVRLEATRTRVTEVVARRDGATLRLRGRAVVLAAGALMTPFLLLNSRSEVWPNGLANDHDVVGRNLMRHYIDVYLFRCRTKEPVGGQVKEISLNDFYHVDGQKFGNVQSMGEVPPYDFFMNSSRRTRRLFGAVRGLVGDRWRTMMQERIIVLASIMEDLPRWSNRVLLGPGSAGHEGPRLRLEYTMNEADRKRYSDYNRILGRALRGYPGSWISPLHLGGGKINSALGHQCGTCRFGDDPKTSVLDRNNRAWGLDNLYVVDGSMLPSSSGINPSLTIAANALRVAETACAALLRDRARGGMAVADRVRLGVLGAARIVQTALISAAKNVPEVTVSALAARDRDRASKYAREHGIPRVHESYTRLLADPDLDAVYVPLPNALHAEWSIRAMESGKHVLCEKPIACNEYEAMAIADAASRTGRIICEAMHPRYHELASRLEAIRNAGTVGEVRHVQARVGFPIPSTKDIRWQYELGGGALMDMGVYAVWLVRLLAGDDPSEVTGVRVRLRAPDVDRRIEADLCFPGGVTGRVMACMWGWPPVAFSAMAKGTQGRVTVINPITPQMYHMIKIEVNGTTRHERVAARPDSYTAQLRAFADAVLRGVPPLTGPSEFVPTMRVIDAIYGKAGLSLRGAPSHLPD
jgi:predicted dehydrogenase/choline dehydrogenase-like flavoprotein